MAEVIEYRFRLRRAHAATWTSINDILLDGEIGLEKDTGKVKIGDGSTPWNDLDYSFAGAIPVAGDGITIDDTIPEAPVIHNDGVRGLSAGDGIDIDDSDPRHPQIINTRVAINLSGRVAGYDDLPGGLAGGDAGKAWIVEDDSLVYIWDGTTFPADGTGIAISGGGSGGLNSYTGGEFF
ncbi:MAG: hypothetical protein DI597_00730 [Pseudoxanthomonas spadix]|nr:MAG: hypothetical protein DI597_00730 [Pseudoxanthomonas spadix]